MGLRLRVVSEQRRSLGDRGSAVFGPAGGTIGRAADNDWVLPDPLRYVSAHHARVSFRDGQYLLEDLSTNGAYVNDDERPLSKMGPYVLRNGDLLRLGEYQVVVALEAETEAPAVVNSDVMQGVPTSIHALHPVGRVAQTDIGAALDLDALLETGVGHEFAPAAAAPPPAPAMPAPMENSGRRMVAGGTESLLSDEPTDSAINRRIARLAKAVARSSRSNAASPAPSTPEGQNGFAAFCRGAGVHPERLPADAQNHVMHLVGQLLREALVGLKDLDRSRQEIRNRFRIEIPTEADDPRPSFARYTADELLLELFNQHDTRRLDAVQWLREAVNAAKEHESAVVQALRTSFIEFLDRLDPAELEARFQRAARRGKTNAEYWEMYAEFYRNLIEMPADQLPHTFVETFARAYRDLIGKKPTD